MRRLALASTAPIGDILLFLGTWQSNWNLEAESGGVAATLSTLAFDAATNKCRNDAQTCLAASSLISANCNFKLNCLNLADAVLYRLKGLFDGWHNTTFRNLFLCVLDTTNNVLNCSRNEFSEFHKIRMVSVTELDRPSVGANGLTAM